MIYVIGLLVVIIIILVYKLFKKQQLDTNERENYNVEIKKLSESKQQLISNIKAQTEQYNFIKQQITKCNQEFSQRSVQLQNYFYKLRKQRGEQLESEYISKKEQRQKILELQYQKIKQFCEAKIRQVKQNTDNTIQALNDRAAETNQKIVEWEQQYNNLLEPFKRLQQQKMKNLFYTIQIPEQYQKDMNYLLTVVAPQVNHPDIISKLIWQEYVKPYLDDTFKRIEIKDEPGIYKLTYIENNKCYVGKSTNVKKRITNHFKSAVGIQSIADQAVHHQIKNTGLWNWMIEVIGYFPKEELSEKQKFYIKQFQAIQYGFNKNSGG